MGQVDFEKIPALHASGLENHFLYFSYETYVVGTQKNRLN